MGRRDSKQTDVYEPPARAATLTESGRRIPLRHSDAPDYDSVSVVTRAAPGARRGLWLVVALVVLAGLAAVAWRVFG
ncbi:MAG TPA: hypothetical protein VFU21_31115 [Kofleriaceae bacterium]|nr:hypothetical protein [Kofleriaceae bacterium]